MLSETHESYFSYKYLGQEKREALHADVYCMKQKHRKQRITSLTTFGWEKNSHFGRSVFRCLFVYGLEKRMHSRDTWRRAGSDARGEGKESGNLIENHPKPLDAQRASGNLHKFIFVGCVSCFCVWYLMHFSTDGICLYIYLYIYI